MASILDSIRGWFRAPRAEPVRPHIPPAGIDGVAFQCNLCGQHNRVPPECLGREIASCRACGSTVRFRAIVQLLVHELLGVDEPLPTLPVRRDLRGIGLSDADTYAIPLSRHFSYTNTRFHAQPRLDISAVPDDLAGRHRFLVASDVFEHVVPPVARAFAGARKLLDADGVFVFSVPFSLEADTVEHFPDLHRFRIEGEGSRRVLHNTTQDGRHQTFDNLVFHGGDGATLEMRCFSRDAVERELRAAGFTRVRFAQEAHPRFGIVWREPWSVPVVARP